MSLAPLAVLAATALSAPEAMAASVNTSLTASNGEGTSDASLPCGAGDGPSWRYSYSGGSAPAAGLFGGAWLSSIEVHDAGANHAYIPAGTGRLRIQAARGNVNLLFSGGSCTSAPMTLSTDVTGDPQVAGALPMTASGGEGSFRGITGSGTVSITNLVLGPGADNTAALSMTGNFLALQPHLGVAKPPLITWDNLLAYAANRLTVAIPVINTGPATTNGDAFGVVLTQAFMDQNVGNAQTGVPGVVGQLNASASQYVITTFTGAFPGKTYNLTTTVAGNDALDTAVAPVTQTQAVKVPLLPQLVLPPLLPPLPPV